MLPRAQRLNSREFAVVFENSRVLRHPLLQLRFYKHRENLPHAGKDGAQKSKRRAGETRAAFVAPKKLGNAVLRNAIRRKARERYRIFREEAIRGRKWPVELENCDLVFLATAQCSTATSEQIDHSLAYLLKNAARKAAT